MSTRRIAIAALGLLLLSIIVAIFYVVGEVSVEDVEAKFSGNSITVLVDIRNSMLRRVCIIGVELSGADSYLNNSVRVELHRTKIIGNVVRMEKAGLVCIKQGDLLSMKDRGLHIMIIGDRESIEEIIRDKVVSLRLLLDNGDKLEVNAFISTD